MTAFRQSRICACDAARAIGENDEISFRHPAPRGLAWLAIFLLVLSVGAALAQNVGTRDFSFGTTGLAAPTGQKPESKLWFNDGLWWACLYNNTAQAYHVYRFDTGANNWIDTGTQLDDRNTSSADVLWDGTVNKLYVASHIFAGTGAVSTSQSNWGRLYRYSYNSATKTYSQDSGFPITVNSGTSETMVIARDSSGTLWVTFTQGQKVMVNHSINGNDASWGTPFVVPANGSDATVTVDDISAVIAFGPGKIGVMWSNQSTQKFYFAVHLDGEADSVWQPEETALPGPTGTENSDDHINLKSLQSDGSGRVFAAIKTSLTASSSPLVMLLVRGSSGGWSNYTFGRYADKHTRPIVLLDVDHNKIFMFAASPDAGTPQSIYYKVSDLNNISFPLGKGGPVLQSTVDVNINNPTSTKQNVSSATGLLLMGADSTTRYYLHTRFTLSGAPQPAVSSFTPKSSPPGAQVTITGSNFTDASVVAFNGRASSQFTIVSSTQINATIPTGAATGPITVSNSSGLIGTSTSNFTVTTAPSITSFTPTSGPVGTLVTISGKGFTATSSVQFNSVSASFTIKSDKTLTAIVPAGATTGPIRVTNPAGSAASATIFTVQ